VETLRELLIFTGAIKPDTHQLLIDAFEESETWRWRLNSDNSPHEGAWHESFHASSFPGDDPLACPRKALYTLMDFASQEPFSGRTRQFFGLGKAGELVIVDSLARAGVLISADQNEAYKTIQTGFTEPEHWLTGNADALALPKGTASPVPLEIKFKRHAKFTEIKQGLTPPPPENVRQIKTYTAGMHLHLHKILPTVLVCGKTGMVATGVTSGVCRMHGTWTCLKEIQLSPIQQGALVYCSFDEPDINQAKVFPIEVDLDFYYAGLAKLKLWRQWFEKDELPSLAPTYNGNRGHPHGGQEGWGWSKDPCRYCDHKPICQLDHRAGVTQLTQSHGVRHTKDVRAPVGHTYDPEETRQAVFDRWSTNIEEEKAA
jgi:hypothetical protein